MAGIFRAALQRSRLRKIAVSRRLSSRVE